MAKNAATAAARRRGTWRARTAAGIRVEAHAIGPATATISTLSASEVVHSATCATAAPELAATPLKNKFVGVHVSAAGGADRAVANSLALGPLARSLALFVRPRLSWKPVPPLSDPTIAKFHELLSDNKVQQIQLDKIVVHGSYLINLGSHDANLREKSVELMVEEVRKCAQLGVPLYVFHPGSCTGSELTQRRKLADAQSRASQKKSKKRTSKKQRKTEADDREARDDELSIGSPSEDLDENQVRRQSIAFVAESMVKVLEQTKNVMLVVENMSGQGNVLGSSFRELRAILDGVMELPSRQQHQEEPQSGYERRAMTQERLGVCLDTCHAFASGYDLTTTENCEQMMRDFDECMLPQWPNALHVVHLNDSKAPCGSKADRHANIGYGGIGLEAFCWVMNSARFEDMPLILETPRPKKTKKDTKKPKLSDDEDENGEIGSSTKGKKRRTRAKKQTDETVGIPSATEELELLYGLVVE